MPDRKSMYVTVQANGYGGRTLFEPFAKFRRVTVRVYRPNLQWPMYGATRVARAGAGAHPHPSAVQDCLVRAARRAHRVPRRRRQRGRVRRQPQWDGVRDHDAPRPRAVAPPHERDDGVVARRVRHRARPPLDERARVAARSRDRQRALELPGRIADRVVAERPRRRRLLRHLGRARDRARPAHASRAVDAAPRREDHLERGDRGRHALHRRLRGPAVGALRRLRARRAGTRR